LKFLVRLSACQIPTKHTAPWNNNTAHDIMSVRQHEISTT